MNKSILAITGPTSGIGRGTVLELVDTFDQIMVLWRNLEKGARLKDDLLELNANLSVDIVWCDLCELSSVNDTAKTIKDRYDHIDCLINNAGIVSTSGQESVDGYELMMATNYLGPFLLTHLLLPLVMNSERKQVIVVSYGAYKFAPMTQPFFILKRFSPITGYGRSKLGNL